MPKFKINDPEHKSFQEFCQSISLKIFNNYTNLNGELGLVDEDLILHSVLKEQMSFILLSSTEYNIIFKTMFSISGLKTKLSGLMGLPEEKVNNSLVNDYMNEYCNLVAGTLKKLLIFNLNSDIGISIPLISSGFEGFYFPIGKRNTQYFYWKINTNEFDIILVLEIECLRGFKMDKLIGLREEDDKKDSDFFNF